MSTRQHTIGGYSMVSDQPDMADENPLVRSDPSVRSVSRNDAREAELRRAHSTSSHSSRSQRPVFRTTPGKVSGETTKSVGSVTPVQARRKQQLSQRVAIRDQRVASLNQDQPVDSPEGTTTVLPMMLSDASTSAELASDGAGEELEDPLAALITQLSRKMDSSQRESATSVAPPRDGDKARIASSDVTQEDHLAPRARRAQQGVVLKGRDAAPLRDGGRAGATSAGKAKGRHQSYAARARRAKAATMRKNVNKTPLPQKDDRQGTVSHSVQQPRHGPAHPRSKLPMDTASGQERPQAEENDSECSSDDANQNVQEPLIRMPSHELDKTEHVWLWYGEHAEGLDSPPALASRQVACTTNDQLLQELRNAPFTLTGVTIDGTDVTLDGINDFVRHARELQKRREMTCEFELSAMGCYWENGELASLGEMALSKLKLENVNGVPPHDWKTFSTRVRQLQNIGGRDSTDIAMTRDFELDISNCDFPHCDLPELLAGLALSKLQLSGIQGTPDGWNTFKTMRRRQKISEQRALALHVRDANWGHGQLKELAEMPLRRLSLMNVTGTTITDVCVFMVSARRMQEEEAMPLDFELRVDKACKWTIDHWRGALRSDAPSFKSIDFECDAVAKYSDFPRLIARKVETQGYPFSRLHVHSGAELSTILELIAAYLRSPSAAEKRTGGALDTDGFAILLSDELQSRYPSAWSTLNLNTIETSGWSEETTSCAAFLLTGLPPMQVAVALAAYCKEWTQNYPSAAVILSEFAEQFDMHACALLDKCNTAQEAERLLLAPFASEKLARGKLPVFDFALQHRIREFVSHQWVQSYATELWNSADVYYVPRCFDSQNVLQTACELYANPKAGLREHRSDENDLQESKNNQKTLTGALFAVLTLCAGTALAAIRVICLSLIGIGGAWTVVPISCVLAALMIIQFGLLDGWTWLLLALVACLAGTAVKESKIDNYRLEANGKSRLLFLKISLAWSTPSIKFSLFCFLYVSFVLIVTDLAFADRSFVTWSEVAMYMFGVGLMLAEATQMKHDKPVGLSWTTEIQRHLSGWNALDVSIVFLICTCACQRLPLIGVYSEIQAEVDVSSGSSTEEQSVVGSPGFLGLWVDDSTAGQHSIAVLCIAAWIRLLGLMVISPDLGPLILMVMEMRADLRRFTFLCAAFILGFGASIATLLIDDRHSSISSLSDAVHSTFQGIIGTQDIEPVSVNWAVEAIYTVYLVLAQVLLLNLLIAMFTSTYERIKENEIDEWRVARAQIILEYSHTVRGVFELPMLNLIGLVFMALGWLWRCLRHPKCCGRVTKWTRLRVPWEPLQEPKRFVKVARASDYTPEIFCNAYVGTEDGRMGVVIFAQEPFDEVFVEWLDWTNTVKVESVAKELLVVAWHPREGEAALEERGWRVEWESVDYYHGTSDHAARELVDGIMCRRSLHDGNDRTRVVLAGPDDEFDEGTLQKRWLDAQEDFDREPADYGELMKRVNDRTDEGERTLCEQMKRLQHTVDRRLHGTVYRRQQDITAALAMQLKVVADRQAALERDMQKQAADSNKRLDRLITLVSVMHNS